MSKKTIAIIILEAVLFIGMGLLLGGKMRDELRISRHNVAALQDTVTTLQMNNGDLLSSRSALILSQKELQGSLDLSKKEVKELRKKLGSDIAYISKLESQLNIKPDTVLVNVPVYVSDSTSEYTFRYDDQWLKIDGSTLLYKDSSPVTKINNIFIPVPLSVGLTEDYKIFVRTPNPYLTITSIDGAVVDKSRLAPRPKRFNIGLQAGIGGQYGLMRQKADWGPYAGVGLSWGFGF